MQGLNITQQRLFNQRLIKSKFTKPSEVVKWLGAVQAQDYPGAKWALSLRIQGSMGADIEKAIVDGSIIRTHVLRPTWHFLAAEDARWILELTAPRVKKIISHYDKKLGLDEKTVLRSNFIFTKALKGNKQLIRTELKEIIKKEGINIDGMRFGFMLAHAELDRVTCSGAKRGKQFTYALFDDRVPKTESKTKEEALAELVRRYFTSHGPAQLQDFVWWSGLTMKDAKEGIELNKQELVSQTINDKTYWFSKSMQFVKNLPAAAYLLPNYDEYMISYKDRSDFFPNKEMQRIGSKNHIFNNSIVLNGKIIGSWKKDIKNKVITDIFVKLTNEETKLVDKSIQDYYKFTNHI